MEKKKIIMVLVMIVLLIVAIFGVSTIRKVGIFNNLMEKAKETEKITNYYMESKSSQDGGVTTKVWSKDENHFLIEIKTESNTIRMYQNGDEKLRTADAMGQKIVKKESGGRILLDTFTNYVDSNNTWKDAQKASIHSVQLGEKECYEIKLKEGDTFTVEKATGVILKNQFTEYSYETNSVTEADIQKPDLTGYTEVN